MPTLKRETLEVQKGTMVVTLEGMEELKKLLIEAQANSAKLGDTVIAKTAAIGRRASMDMYDSAGLEMGGTYFRRPKQGHGAVFDPKMGGYVSRTDRRRIMGFSFENVAYRKNLRVFKSAVSKLYIYDLVANLWENPTKPYSSQSPYWQRTEGSAPSSWFNGRPRPARPFFMSKVYNRVQQSIPEAIARAKREIEIFGRNSK